MPTYVGPNATSRSLDAGAALRLAVWVALSVVLLVLDSRGGWLSQLRAQATLLVQPIWLLAGMPSKAASAVDERFSSRAALLKDNQRLREELLIANARLVRLRAAAQDNIELRERLGAAQRIGLDVQLVPILDVDLDPVRQRLLLTAGSQQGVEVGQAVIDAGGLVGQVVEVTGSQSTVLLITDPDHAIPVTVARNGVRLIAYGRGDRLELRDIPLGAEVEVGDAIVTSGLGGRFPAGFPVGKVTRMRPDDSHAFLIGDLEPAAQLDRGQDVMLLNMVPIALEQRRESTSDAGSGNDEAVAPQAMAGTMAVPRAHRRIAAPTAISASASGTAVDMATASQDTVAPEETP